jgi:hypothetical protein
MRVPKGHWPDWAAAAHTGATKYIGHQIGGISANKDCNGNPT